MTLGWQDNSRERNSDGSVFIFLLYKMLRSLFGGAVKPFNEYSKCSKISNTFLFLFSNNMWLQFQAGIQKILVIVANREDPDHTASSEAV